MADAITIVEAALARALDALQDNDTVLRIGVAYSGGVDSTALLHAAAALHARGRIAVVAFHIHHGLAVAADDWLAHCRERAVAFGVAFDAERVVLAGTGASIEAQARTLRYAALARLCRRHDCTVLLTAHHADDQAESRAAASRCAVPASVVSRRPHASRLDRTTLLLRAAAARHPRRHAARAPSPSTSLPVVEDPSNQDRRFTRNALRLEVMPALRRIAPTVAATPRAARPTHAVDRCRTLLDEIGARGPAVFDHDRRRSRRRSSRRRSREARAANALRVWIARRGMRAPSAASAEGDARRNCCMPRPTRRSRCCTSARRCASIAVACRSTRAACAARGLRDPLPWHGESEHRRSPNWHGRLDFIADANARDSIPLALREGPLDATRTSRRRTHAAACGRSESHAEEPVPGGRHPRLWRRGRLPLVYLDDRLIYAAGIGPHANALRDRSQGLELVRLEWSSLA